MRSMSNVGVVVPVALLAVVLFGGSARAAEKIGILSDTQVGVDGDVAFNLLERSYRLFVRVDELTCQALKGIGK